MYRWLIALILLPALIPAAAATPMDPTLQQQLLGIYDSYNMEVPAGKLLDALKLRPAVMQAEAKKEMGTAAQRRDFLAMAQQMVPDTVKAEHASINAAGDKASIITVAAKTMQGSTMHAEVMLAFVKESGGWKPDDETFGPDPTTIKACKDDKFESVAAYDTDKTVSIGGPIVRVDFQPDYTLVVVRVTDEEKCAFVHQNKEGLLKHGLDPAKLVPYATVEIDGSPHKTDGQKVLVDKLQVHEED